MPLKQMMRYRPGPGMLVTAAFIGPGTVTSCTLAGAQFGYALVWALGFATIATVILQNLSARVALVRGQGLGEAIMEALPSPVLKWSAAALLAAALVLGNAAYEAGNISGSALGIEAIIGGTFGLPLPLLIGLFAIILLATGNPKWLERLLIALVIVMSLSFLVALAVTRPDFGALFAGLVPTLPDGSLLTAMALIGTTVVPYNLFLHAASVRNRWRGAEGLEEASTESAISIGLGGLVSIAILATAAAALFGSNAVITDAVGMAKQIEPLYGELARQALGLGLLGAGLTSALTAPMATGYIVRELWPGADEAASAQRQRWTMVFIALIGTLVASAGIKPVEIIMLAQVANGLLLPLVAAFLVWVVQNPALMGKYAIAGLHRILAWGILAICLGLGIRLILKATGLMP
jgi:NRAMP (natural resistance-associated macrophage protein)-like metal ion transporter